TMRAKVWAEVTASGGETPVDTPSTGARGSTAGQQAHRQTLDVAGFRDRQVHWMVGAMGTTLEQLDVAVQVAGAGQQDVLQVVLGQVHGAAGADQDAILV